MSASPRMTCRELVDFLMDYLDGELQPSVRADFEWHLSVCPNCVRYLETYEATLVLAREAFHRGEGARVPASVPEELVQAILSARPR